MSLLLPTWQNTIKIEETANNPSSAVLPKHLIKQEALTKLFTSRLHWELSTTLTSNHLLGMVSMSNTLMSMNMATFLNEDDRPIKSRYRYSYK